MTLQSSVKRARPRQHISPRDVCGCHIPESLARQEGLLNLSSLPLFRRDSQTHGPTRSLPERVRMQLRGTSRKFASKQKTEQVSRTRPAAQESRAHTEKLRDK